jgi:glutathione S-transferase
LVLSAKVCQTFPFHSSAQRYSPRVYLTWNTAKFLDFNKNEQKQSPHIDYNPNGRIPTLVDRNNNDFPVWESNAILMYLIDQYDPENKHAFLGKTAMEKTQVIQWLFFQASGQGE